MNKTDQTKFSRRESSSSFLMTTIVFIIVGDRGKKTVKTPQRGNQK